MQTETVPSDLQDSFIFDAWDALGHFEAATAKLQTIFEPEVLKELAIVTHRLKGAAALYRYPQVSSLAERLLAQSKYLPAAETLRVRAFLEKVAVCLQDALTRIAEGRAEGDLGLELNYLGGSTLLQELLRDTSFDALLSDLEMPRMNGFELIEEVRRKSGLAELPLLVMTTRAGEKHMRLAFELGATDYLTKPVDETKLLGFLSRVTASNSTNRTAAN